MRCSEYIRSNPTATKEDVVSNVGCNPDTATRALKKFRNLHATAVVKTEITNPQKMTLLSWRNNHDITLMIRNGIARFFGVEGNEDIMTDTSFREGCGVSIQQWRHYASQDEFRGNQVKVKDQIYWASNCTIKAMKRILGRPEDL